jgi:hypothetical protein
MENTNVFNLDNELNQLFTELMEQYTHDLDIPATRTITSRGQRLRPTRSREPREPREARESREPGTAYRNTETNASAQEIAHYMYEIMTQYNENMSNYQENVRLFIQTMNSILLLHRTNGARQQQTQQQQTPSPVYVNTPRRSRYRNPTHTILSYLLQPYVTTTPATYEDVVVRPSEEEINIALRRFIWCQETSTRHTHCPITLEEFQENESVCEIMHCGHIFKEQSILDWFNRNVRCPVCRYDIRQYSVRDSQRATNTTNIQRPVSVQRHVNTTRTARPSTNTSTLPVRNRQATNIIDNFSNGIVDIIQNYITNEMSTLDGSMNTVFTFEIPIGYHDVSGNSLHDNENTERDDDIGVD